MTPSADCIACGSFVSSVVLDTFMGAETAGRVPVGGADVDVPADAADGLLDWGFFFPTSRGFKPFMIPPFFLFADGGLPFNAGEPSSSEVRSSEAGVCFTLMGPEICSFVSFDSPAVDGEATIELIRIVGLGASGGAEVLGDEGEAFTSVEDEAEAGVPEDVDEEAEAGEDEEVGESGFSVTEEGAASVENKGESMGVSH